MSAAQQPLACFPAAVPPQAADLGPPGGAQSCHCLPNAAPRSAVSCSVHDAGQRSAAAQPPSWACCPGL